MTTQLLTFTLNNNLYAFEVFKVQEVLEYTTPVKIPCSSPYVEGLINSRGTGISVINLRKKFSLPDSEPTKDTRIIVVEINKPTEENPDHICTFGAITDSVQEVLEINDKDIEPPPKFGNNISPEYISGLTKKDDKFIIILNEKIIFSASETAKANQ
ncbi:MAG: chemotaxis protein CheW [Treponema sp.]|nr:chemotaxis protein CheW [Candidatus Treponema merdequi]